MMFLLPKKKKSCVKGLLIINELLLKQRNKTTQLVLLGVAMCIKKYCLGGIM
jgi:hypothetical protein